ncbi:hypothetical protein PbJCM13498_12280 [Prolixibacter bellariivorans]|uniref:Uncharacterized protein n=1 Tax=Prolixibacter bellariivorans TaxID=314319 RepID=A0A5M4AWR6_9BACT|nr:hypothetical protein PbJCM13498_12280 [Prolixibacter bellariivorans]
MIWAKAFSLVCTIYTPNPLKGTKTLRYRALQVRFDFLSINKNTDATTTQCPKAPSGVCLVYTPKSPKGDLIPRLR